MHTTTTTLDVLFVTGGSATGQALSEQLSFDSKTIRVSTAASIDEATATLATKPIDCVLCADSSSGDRCLSFVRTLASEFPALPVVVFAGPENDTLVSELLHEGATDVIQSTQAETPPSLVLARLKNVVNSGQNPTMRPESVERYETILNTAGDAIYQLDPTGTFVAVNDATVGLTGYEREELVGEHVSMLISDEDIAEGERLIRRQLAEDEHTIDTLEVEIETKDCEWIPCDSRITVISIDGRMTGSVGIMRDVTEEREREAELRKRDELLAHIAESVSDVVWITTADKDEMEFISAAYEDVWGRSQEELYDNPQAFVDAIHPDDQQRLQKALVEQQVDPDSYDGEYRIVQPDGEIRHIHDRAYGVYDENGELTRIVGVARDITERKRSKEQLEAEHDMFAQGPAVVFKWQNSEGWPVDYVSENVTDLLGYTPEQLKSGEIAYAELIHEDDIDRVTGEVVKNSEGTIERFSHEPYRLVTSSGDSIWVKDTTKIIRENGEVTAYLGYLVDTTERKEREEELQQLKEEYELMVNTVGDVVYTLDPEFEFMSVNGAAAAVTGYTAEELEGEHISQLLSAEAMERAREYRQRVISGEIETGTIEFEITRKDGSTAPVEFRYRRLPSEEGFVGTAGVLRDITGRKEREAKIESQRDELAQLNRLNGIIRDIDQALVGATTREEVEQAVCKHLTAGDRYGFALTLRLRGENTLVPHAWTDAGAEFVEDVFPAENLEPETSPGLRALTESEIQVTQSLDAEIDDHSWKESLDAAGIESLATIPVSYQGTSYGIIVVYGEAANTFTEREVEVLTELGETVGYAIAAVERREREQMLTVLYEATQDLLGAESETEVCELVVETAANVLRPPGIGIFLFDGQENVLEAAATTDVLDAYYGDAAQFGPGKADAVVWETYVSGETKFYEDIREAERLANPETDARAALIVPLGDHGVFVAASPDTTGFDGRMRQLVGLLAATTEAALDRVAGRLGIRERDEELAARGERLERVERVLDCVRDVDQLLIQAGTRDEIERGICERVTEMEPYDFAWIGTVPPDGTAVEPRVWAGTEDGYLDAVSFDIGDSEPVAATATSGKPTTISNVTDHLRDGEWAGAAINRDFQSVAAVPLVYGETTYGILGIYATAVDAFEEPVDGVLAELGELIAYIINSVETRQGILSERMTELELHIETPDAFLNAVARVAGESVSYREILPEEGGTAQVLFGLDDPPVDEILALEDEFVAVEALSHVDATDEHIFRATLGGEMVAATLLRCGGLPHKVVRAGDETHVVVWIPQELEVRVYLDRVRESYPETSLVSRQTVESRTERPTIDEALASKLTDRQREVLLTAYRCGFFQSPRETTGAELAELLNISQPTLTHHLREAQRRLFEAMYETAS